MPVLILGYSNVPRESLHVFIATLCCVVNMASAFTEAWRILMATHLGHSVPYDLCQMVQDDQSLQYSCRRWWRTTSIKSRTTIRRESRADSGFRPWSRSSALSSKSGSGRLPEPNSAGNAVDEPEYAAPPGAETFPPLTMT